MSTTALEYLPAGEDFQDGLSLLEENLPEWWAKAQEGSEIHILLVALAWAIDDLSASLQQIFLDRVLTRAGVGGLQRTWETVWGVGDEQVQQVRDVLVPYILARIAEDGSLESLTFTLMAMILAVPLNTTTGTVLLLDATFPATGEGLALWEWDGDTYPLPTMGLFFDRNGSGIKFPVKPDEVLTDNILVSDGSVGITGFPAYPLTFTLGGFVVIIEDFANYSYTVQVKSALAFDRDAFRRAVFRFRPASVLAPVVVEVP